MRSASQRRPGSARGTHRFLCAIDPGVDATGVALFNGMELIGARLLRDPYGLPFPFVADEIVVEVPVQRGEQSKVRVANLLTVALCAGYLTGQCSSFSVSQWGTKPIAWRVDPQAWKGQRTKSVDNARTLRILSPVERQCVDTIMPEGLRHNVLDAIGIGLWTLGRTPMRKGW